jgi:hypothetical protein
MATVQSAAFNPKVPSPRMTRFRKVVQFSSLEAGNIAATP